MGKSRDTVRVGWLAGLEGGGNEEKLSGFGGFSAGEEKVLRLDRGGGYMKPQMCQSHFTLQWLALWLHEFCLSITEGNRGRGSIGRDRQIYPDYLS